MKKSILALSALAVVGGLGLAGSAQAVYHFGPGIEPSTAANPGTVGISATGLELNPGSTGHELVVPYYSVQGVTHTMIDIVNTDTVNGKAVKVRFRGAANSDDVLDFTVLMSPGDVWTADIHQGSDTLAHLSSSDRSCTIPSIDPTSDVPFITNRLPGYMSAAQKALNTREGYIEILNMADIPPTTADGTTNILYTAIKHVNGVPPCAGTWPSGHTTQGMDAILDALLTTNDPGATVLSNDYGLDAPTGLLTGGWAVHNIDNYVMFSGDDTVVRAYATAATGTSPGTTGAAAVAFSPQSSNDVIGAFAPTPNTVTADPLLTGGSYPSYPNPSGPNLPIQWYDVPDLSTPLLTATQGLPTAQADILANALAKTNINDEYLADPDGTTLGVRATTDWVLSQPTRRYFAVVDYGSSASGAVIVYNLNDTSSRGSGQAPQGLDVAGNAALPYAGEKGEGAGNLTLEQGASGPVACLTGAKPYIDDREETHAGAKPEFSPGYTTADFCGEVATLTWGGASPLDASLTNTGVQGAYASGWATFQLPLGTTGATYGLPMTGFAGMSGDAGTEGYGITWPLRW